MAKIVSTLLKKVGLGSRGRPAAVDKFKPYIDWSVLLENHRAAWERAVEAASDGPPLLIASGVGGHAPVAILDSLLAVGLTLRGASVRILLCDAQLTACEKSIYQTNVRDLAAFIDKGNPETLCANCHGLGELHFKALGLPVLRYSDYLTSVDREESREIPKGLDLKQINNFEYRGLKVGEQALANLRRFLVVGTLENTPEVNNLARRFLTGALRAAAALEKCLVGGNYECVSGHHGVYVPQGILSEVARKTETRVAHWTVAYRNQSFIFSHGQTYTRTMLTEPVSIWEDMVWDDSRENKIMAYLKSRASGSRDWISFNTAPHENFAALEKESGVDFSKPCIALLTNVTWDAQIVYTSNAFPDLLQWVADTIGYFSRRPELQLIIRTHPGEITGTMVSRERVGDEMRKRFPELPQNVAIVDPENRISTYALAEKCDAALIYGTKTGVELAAMGIPVITAGEAWVRNKGITVDVESREAYFKELDKLPYGQRMSAEKKRRALKYAYHYFFHRMIPVKSLRSQPEFPHYRIQFNRLEELGEGGDEGLEAICRGILRGDDFLNQQ